jgi:hypothetical protein
MDRIGDNLTGPFIVEGEGKNKRGVPKGARDWIREKDWGECIYEGLAPDPCKGPPQTDHVLIAWSKLERHDILNLATACQHHNCSKNNLTPEEFLGPMEAIVLRERLMSANIRRGVRKV